MEGPLVEVGKVVMKIGSVYLTQKTVTLKMSVEVMLTNSVDNVDKRSHNRRDRSTISQPRSWSEEVRFYPRGSFRGRIGNRPDMLVAQSQMQFCNQVM